MTSPTPSAVLTLTEAAEALRVRRSAGLAWLRDRGLIVRVGDAERVVWGDVLDELHRGQPRARVDRPGRRRVDLPFDPA